MHLLPGGYTAQTKMAAVRLYWSSTLDYKVIRSCYEICFGMELIYLAQMRIFQMDKKSFQWACNTPSRSL